MISLLALALVLHAPTEEQTNIYQIEETIWTSRYGTVVLTGEETRHIGKPLSGNRAVNITYRVDLKSKNVTGKGGDSWAAGELYDLRAPDRGTLDDRDRLNIGGEVSTEAFPLLPLASHASVGESWGSEKMVNGIAATYRLHDVTEGVAHISTEAEGTTPQGRLRRSGFWKIDVASGRLLAWNIHSEVKYRDGSREAIDSVGKLRTPTPR